MIFIILILSTVNHLSRVYGLRKLLLENRLLFCIKLDLKSIKSLGANAYVVYPSPINQKPDQNRRIHIFQKSHTTWYHKCNTKRCIGQSMYKWHDELFIMPAGGHKHSLSIITLYLLTSLYALCGIRLVKCLVPLAHSMTLS